MNKAFAELERAVNATLEAYVENDEDWETDEGTLKLRHDGNGGLLFSLEDEAGKPLAQIRFIKTLVGVAS